MTAFTGPDTQPGANARPVIIYGWDSVTDTFRPITIDSSGQIVSGATTAAKFTNIAAIGTVTVKASPGTFRGLIINKAVAASTVVTSAVDDITVLWQ